MSILTPPSEPTTLQAFRSVPRTVRAALEHQVICVPGVFFDVNPGHRRAQRLSRFHQHVRLSFGPSLEEVRGGLDRLEEMIRAAKG